MSTVSNSRRETHRTHWQWHHQGFRQSSTVPFPQPPPPPVKVTDVPCSGWLVPPDTRWQGQSSPAKPASLWPVLKFTSSTARGSDWTTSETWPYLTQELLLLEWLIPMFFMICLSPSWSWPWHNRLSHRDFAVFCLSKTTCIILTWLYEFSLDSMNWLHSHKICNFLSLQAMFCNYTVTGSTQIDQSVLPDSGLTDRHTDTHKNGCIVNHY